MHPSFSILLRPLALSAMLVSALPETLHAAQSESDLQKNLATINQQIQSLDKQRSEREGKQGKLQQRLKSLDRQISKNANSLAKLEKEAKALNNSRAEVKNTLHSQDRAQSTQQQQLAQQLQQYYVEWRRAGSRSLLQVGPIDQHLRNQVYFQHLHTARLAELARIQGDQNNTSQRDSKLSRKLDQLKKVKAKALAKQKELAKNKKARKQTLAELSKLEKKDKDKLSALKQDQKELNRLVDKLRALASQPDAIRMGKVPFNMLKGKLKWPVKGTVSKSTSGVKITTPSGVKVRSVGYGRVVFSDWMRGFGMLMIVDHGDGYMSLYGKNSSLSRQQGDTVEPGTILGISGSEDSYFEIRKDASPLDPRQWCTKT